MLDIDDFKRINDRFGHQAGDECIRSVARAVALVEGIVARMGGEEFTILLPGRERGAATAVAECLRQTVAELRVRAPIRVLSLTCSIGVSEWAPGDTIDGLLARADIALYSAKAGGRNRVEVDDTSRAVPNDDGGGDCAERVRSPRGDLATVYDELVKAISADR